MVIKAFGNLVKTQRSHFLHGMAGPGIRGEALIDENGPGGQFPPDMGKITLIIIGGMCVNEMHWIGYWVLVTLSGNS
jgi:hypothetical protein